MIAEHTHRTPKQRPITPASESEKRAFWSYHKKLIEEPGFRSLAVWMSGEFNQAEHEYVDYGGPKMAPECLVVLQRLIGKHIQNGRITTEDLDEERERCKRYLKARREFLDFAPR